jgi:trimethylamine:corrinoid methyltransferase-like protein
MTGKIKAITDPKLSLEILSPDEIHRLHTATLDIIENAGVRFPSKSALDIWVTHGAQVDRNTSVVKVPGHIIEEQRNWLLQNTTWQRENRIRICHWMVIMYSSGPTGAGWKYWILTPGYGACPAGRT